MSPVADPAPLRLVHAVDLAEARDLGRVAACLRGGVTCLWLRDPAACGRELSDAALRLLPLCRASGAVLLVADRPDVALACGADGVQLGRRAVPAAAVRPWFPGRLGVSCHDAADLETARAAGADHAVLSPVWEVPAKGPPLGIEGFRALAAAAGLPVVALGGIDAQRARAAVRAGAVGVAVLRALRDAADPEGVARALAAAVTGP